MAKQPLHLKINYTKLRKMWLPQQPFSSSFEILGLQDRYQDTFWESSSSYHSPPGPHYLSSTAQGSHSAMLTHLILKPIRTKGALLLCTCPLLSPSSSSTTNTLSVTQLKLIHLIQPYVSSPCPT